ncbi:MAG: molybdopterin-dependent oxidoreductase [Dehalococcoidia bacterium]|nr:molybdopterin-dependent oxidoreductase [Dehalococcoidia bacterium]
MAEEKFVYTACMGNGCHEHCFLKTYVKDGKIVRTEQAVLGPPEGLRYGICQKGIEYARFPYLPTRLLYPLKRVGKRGEGKFERISWEQAMDEIGAKLREIRDKYGPEAVLVNTFACGYPANWTALHMVLTRRFVHTFGATASTLETVDRGFWFSTQFDMGAGWRYSNYDPRLLVGARYIFIWGSNPIGATRATGSTRFLLDAQEQGAKMVTIGLVYDSTAAKSDQFVPIKGGTDAALAMAMNRILIEEDLYDHDYVTNHTVAPLLVREDNGRLLRESDIIAGGDPKKYVFWNLTPAEARTIAARTHDFGTSAPDLFASPVINGIPCKTAFLKLKEHLAEWTPERQETLTGVPAQTVRQLTYDFVKNKPAAIWLNLGLRYYNAREAHRAIQLLSALSGNLGLKHGKLALIAWCDGWPVRMNDGPVSYPDGPENAKGDRPPVTDVLESFRKPGESKYKALLNVMGNPVHSAPGRQLWTEELIPRLDLIVDYEVRVTDTAVWADYVLPDTTTFERSELLVPLGDWAVLQEPAIEPLGEVKSPADFWRMLAKQVGLEKYFDKTQEAWLELRLKSKDPAIAGINPPLTMERLKKEKMVRLNVPTEPFDAFDYYGFVSPTGRFEFYCEDMADVDEAMAKWLPPLIHSPKRKDYPLHLMVARHRVFMQTQFTDFPDLRQIAGDEPWMRINPEDAATRGILDGDLVEVFNERGKVKVKARLSQVVPPGVVQMWFGYRAGEYLEGVPTQIQVPLGWGETQDAAGRKWVEVVANRWLPRPGEKVTWETLAAGRVPATANTETQFAGNWDVIWDNYCEVKKAAGGK